MDNVFDFIFSASALSTLLFWLFAKSIWQAYLYIFHPKSILAPEKKVYSFNLATEIERTIILCIAIIVTIIAYFMQK
jgi:hypothetical protein